MKGGSAPCEDRTHDLQISTLDYETDALPTALTRHCRYLRCFLGFLLCAIAILYTGVVFVA